MAFSSYLHKWIDDQEIIQCLRYAYRYHANRVESPGELQMFVCLQCLYWIHAIINKEMGRE